MEILYLKYKAVFIPFTLMLQLDNIPTSQGRVRTCMSSSKVQIGKIIPYEQTSPKPLNHLIIKTALWIFKYSIILFNYNSIIIFLTSPYKQFSIFKMISCNL